MECLMKFKRKNNLKAINIFLICMFLFSCSKNQTKPLKESANEENQKNQNQVIENHADSVTVSDSDGEKEALENEEEPQKPKDTQVNDKKDDDNNVKDNDEDSNSDQSAPILSLAVILEKLENLNFSELLEENEELNLSSELIEVSNALWQKYLRAVNEDGNRKSQHENRAITYGNSTMRFSLDTIGQMPESGYSAFIALHGGGGAPPPLNDSQWEQMKIYYKSSVDNGVYIAPRGISNTYNLHFMPDSYPLYDRMIENLIAYENVNPNKIFILGFSAGGDGVYQIAPRMPDRWAGANMSAGHSNGVSLINVFNTPFLIQMGEMDTAYNRHTVAAQNYLNIQGFDQQWPGYKYEIFLHKGGSHNSWRDNDPLARPQEVILDPQLWLNENNREATMSNTNAIQWLSQYERNPVPEVITWDLATFANRPMSYGEKLLAKEEHKNLLSPLDSLNAWVAILETDERSTGFLQIRMSDSENTIEIESIKSVRSLRILLAQQHFDFEKPVSLFVEGTLVDKILAKPNLSTMTRSLLERGDPSYIFHAEINLVQDGESWKISL